MSTIQEDISKGKWLRVVWLLLLNIMVIAMVFIFLGQDALSFLPFLILYSCLMPLIGLLMSKSQLKKAYQLEILNQDQSYGDIRDWYIQVTHQCAQQAGMTVMPEVAIYESHDINAFATGRSKNSSLVALSTGLLSTMSEDAIKAVIAHEIAHIVNGDMVTQTLLQSTLKMLVNLVVLPLIVIKWFLIIFGNRGSELATWVIYLVQILASTILLFLAGLVAKLFSRQREFKADDLAARLTSPQSMIQALSELKGGARLTQQQKPYAAMQFNGMKSWADLFSTHPNLERRINYIKNKYPTL